MIDDYEDDPWQGAPTAPAPAPQWNQWGIPPNSNQPAGTMDLSYWMSRGVTPDQIFDENGQTRPGWNRTGRGYEQTGASQPLGPTPPPAPTTYSGGDYHLPGERMGGGGGADPGAGFQWPSFNAPSFNAPTPFSYEAFKQPDFKDIFNDPSYKGRRDEGLQAIEHGAAAKGLTRLPNTLKALGSWNQDFASREYGNIFDRSANTWSMNRNNAADNYSKNYGISRDVFDRSYTGAKDTFDMNEFQPAKLTFEDLYRRWKSELDSTTAIATGDYT